MAKRLSANSLQTKLKPLGFIHNLPEVLKGGISFVRLSSVERLYEHLRISPGISTSVDLVISAASFTSCHRCVSEKDDRFRLFLSKGDWTGTVRIETASDVKEWQPLLIENVQEYCERLADDSGVSLAARLQPTFSAVDRYVHRFGDLFEVFDREYAFSNEGSTDETSTIEWLSIEANRWLYLASNDAKLASTALVRWSRELEEQDLCVREKLLCDNAELSTRLILIVDYIRNQRDRYEAAGESFLCREKGKEKGCS